MSSKKMVEGGEKKSEMSAKLWLNVVLCSVAFMFSYSGFVFTHVTILIIAVRNWIGAQYGTLVIVAVFASWVAATYPAGLLMERWGRKKIMIVGGVVNVAGCAMAFAGHIISPKWVVV